MNGAHGTTDQLTDHGATGGPGNARGVSYQTAFAVGLCLDAIAVLLRENPTAISLLRIEPRILSESAVTRWDIETNTPAIAYEAKVNPSKEDAIEFVSRVKSGMSQNNGRRYEFVAGKASHRYVRALETLCRLQREESHDPDRFARLCDVEMDDGMRELLNDIGPNPLAFASKVAITHIPPDILDKWTCFDSNSLWTLSM